MARSSARRNRAVYHDYVLIVARAIDAEAAVADAVGVERADRAAANAGFQRREIDRIAAVERQCLNLRAEGLRYREIGEILGIATPTVGEFLRRAIKKMMLEQ